MYEAWDLFVEIERELADLRTLQLPYGEKNKACFAFSKQAIADYETMLMRSDDTPEQAREASKRAEKVARENFLRAIQPTLTEEGLISFNFCVTGLMHEADALRLKKYMGVTLEFPSMRMRGRERQFEALFEFPPRLSKEEANKVINFLRLPWKEKEKSIKKEVKEPGNVEPTGGKQAAVKQLQVGWVLAVEYERWLADYRAGVTDSKAVKLERRLAFCKQAIADYETMLVRLGDTAEQVRATSAKIEKIERKRFLKEIKPRLVSDHDITVNIIVEADINASTMLDMLHAGSLRLKKYMDVEPWNINTWRTRDKVRGEYVFWPPLSEEDIKKAVEFLALPWEKQEELIKKAKKPEEEQPIVPFEYPK